MLWLALLVLTAAPWDACRNASPTEKVPLDFGPASTLKEAAIWFEQVTCVPVAVPPEAEKKALGLTVKGQLPRGEAAAVLRLVARSAGYTAEPGPKGMVVYAGWPSPDAGVGAAAPPAPSCKALPLKVRRAAPGQLELPAADAERLARHKGCALQEAAFLPVTREGEVVGYQLQSIRPGSVWQQLGFVDGDVLTHVNGFSLVDPQSAQEAERSLPKAELVEVDFERKGQARQLEIVVSRLAR